MDRNIPIKDLQKRRNKIIAISLLSLATIIAVVFLLRNSLVNKIDASRLLTAVAEVGEVESTITASGEIVPEYEEVITSSIRADIKDIFINVGATVEPNTPIILLDKSFSLLEYKKLQQEFELKENGIKKLELDLKQKSFDLQIADSTKALEIQQLETAFGDATRLRDIGGGTQESIDLIFTKLQIARLGKKKLEFDLDIQKEQTKAKLRELELQKLIQGSGLKKMKEKLARAQVLATRKGVVTWVNDKLGTTVEEGEILARLADLSSFKVIGKCSDIYADQLNVGSSVLIQINAETEIKGEIVRIHPTSKNNITTFDIQLEEQEDLKLRPNMRVEVFIVTAKKTNVVRVDNGPAFKGKAQQQLFVIQNGEAVRRTVRVGLSNFDYVEIESNIQAGEKVVINDMTNYEHLSKIKIN